MRAYDSNGAGLAVNDFDSDGDGWLDIVSGRRTTFPFRACLAISLPSTATKASNLDLLLAMTSLSVPDKLGAAKIGVLIPIPLLATEPSPPTQRKVGAGLVPAQWLSQSWRTISATAGMNSPSYYSHPKMWTAPGLTPLV